MVDAPEMDEGSQPGHLEEVAGYQVEQGYEGPPEIERGSAHVGRKGQWDGGEDHRQHDQCQTDDAQNQVDFDKFAAQWTQVKTACQAGNDSSTLEHRE